MQQQNSQTPKLPNSQTALSTPALHHSITPSPCPSQPNTVFTAAILSPLFCPTASAPHPGVQRVVLPSVRLPGSAFASTVPVAACPFPSMATTSSVSSESAPSATPCFPTSTSTRPSNGSRRLPNSKNSRQHLPCNDATFVTTFVTPPIH